MSTVKTAQDRHIIIFLNPCTSRCLCWPEFQYFSISLFTSHSLFIQKAHEFWPPVEPITESDPQIPNSLMPSIWLPHWMQTTYSKKKGFHEDVCSCSRPPLSGRELLNTHELPILTLQQPARGLKFQSSSGFSVTFFLNPTWSHSCSIQLTS